MLVEIFYKENSNKSGKLSVAVRTLTFASVPIGGIAQQTLGIAMDGYEPVGAVGWANAGSTEFYPYQLAVNGTTLTAYIKSVSTSVLSNVSINVYVLFKAMDY